MITTSASASIAWRTCPRQVLYKKLAKLAPASPQDPSRGYGILVHAGMQAAYEARRDAPVGTAVDSMTEHAEAAEAAILAHDMPGRAHLVDLARMDAYAAVSAVLKRLPGPKPENILGVEKAFRVPSPIPGVILSGYMDLVLRVGKDSVHIRDWKTGKVSDDPETLESHPQVAIYAGAVASLWPQTGHTTVGLYAVREGRELTRRLSEETVEFFTHRVADDAVREREAAERVTTSTVDDTHPPRPGDHCSACPFRAYCPVFQKANVPIRPGVDLDAERARLRAFLAGRD